jgi:hypothetical protein
MDGAADSNAASQAELKRKFMQFISADVRSRFSGHCRH